MTCSTGYPLEQSERGREGRVSRGDREREKKESVTFNKFCIAKRKRKKNHISSGSIKITDRSDGTKDEGLG